MYRMMIVQMGPKEDGKMAGQWGGRAGRETSMILFLPAMSGASWDSKQGQQEVEPKPMAIRGN